MSNNYFQFKQFIIKQDNSAMKVSTDSVILGAWASTDNVSRILDIGTGTGLLALMLAQRSSSEITGIDIDPITCIQACENAGTSSWHSRINIINITLQEYSHFGKEYDLIVCNPPYFSNSLKSNNQRRNMARHNDTLSQKDLLEGVSRLISINGSFTLILPYKDVDGFIKESNNYGFYCNRLLCIRPYKTKDINRILLDFSPTKHTCKDSEFTIRNEDGSYTEEYRTLTRDYYLDKNNMEIST
jgi:tRNA1Val (adenine37-N6)-methyltransferase